MRGHATVGGGIWIVKGKKQLPDDQLKDIYIIQDHVRLDLAKEEEEAIDAAVDAYGKIAEENEDGFEDPWLVKIPQERQRIDDLINELNQILTDLRP